MKKRRTAGGLPPGALCASVKKDGWGVTYTANGKTLTSSAWRAMACAKNRQTGRHYMIESLNLDVGEKVYGLGERFTPYVKNGQVVDMWNEDGGTASEIAYKNIPFFMTNRGYGVLVENTGNVSFEVGSEKVERVQFSLEGQELVYDIFYGETPADILERYTALTGRPRCRPPGASASGFPPASPPVTTKRPSPRSSTAWPNERFR